MGKDIVLRDRSADLVKSLQMMLQSPQDYLIATLKTLQAMVSPSVGMWNMAYNTDLCLIDCQLIEADWPMWWSCRAQVHCSSVCGV